MNLGWAQWLISIIPTTRKIEIKRTMVQGQSGKIESCRLNKQAGNGDTVP
jgi:hypothetical protein